MKIFRECWTHQGRRVYNLLVTRMSARIPLVVTYNPILPPFHWTTNWYQSILQVSERLWRAFSSPPNIAFWRPKNLRDLLVLASLTSTSHEEPSTRPCTVARCKSCPILSAMDVFSSQTTGEQFKVKTRASCKSSTVIYLITCRRCGQQYVGKMGQPLHCRINGHHFDITHRRTEDSPVAAHFKTDAHSQVHMTVMVNDQVRSHDPCLRKIWESRWIRTLETLSPSGMNLRVDSPWSLCVPLEDPCKLSCPVIKTLGCVITSYKVFISCVVYIKHCSL